MDRDSLTPTADAAPRRQELAENLARVRQQIDDKCHAVHRDPAEITIIAVTKRFPVTDIALLRELGVRDFGENRHQEALGKLTELAQLQQQGKQPPEQPAVRWHFIGQLQTNKAKYVARFANLVHTVDRPALVTALNKAAAQQGRRLPILIQISLNDAARQAESADRGGCDPVAALALAQLVEQQSHLRLAGVMGMAPISAQPEVAFELLAHKAAAIQQEFPLADIISAGMSHDFASAIAAGATHVRIGTSLLGEREYLR